MNIDQNEMKTYVGPLPVTSFFYPKHPDQLDSFDVLLLRVDVAVAPDAPLASISATTIGSNSLLVSFDQTPLVADRDAEDDAAAKSISLIREMKPSPSMIHQVAQTSLSYKLRVHTKQVLDRSRSPEISRQKKHLYIACRCLPPLKPHPSAVVPNKEKPKKNSSIKVHGMGETGAISSSGTPPLDRWQKWRLVAAHMAGEAPPFSVEPEADQQPLPTPVFPDPAPTPPPPSVPAPAPTAPPAQVDHPHGKTPKPPRTSRSRAAKRAQAAAANSALTDAPPAAKKQRKKTVKPEAKTKDHSVENVRLLVSRYNLH